MLYYYISKAKLIASSQFSSQFSSNLFSNKVRLVNKKDEKTKLQCVWLIHVHNNSTLTCIYCTLMLVYILYIYPNLNLSILIPNTLSPDNSNGYYGDDDNDDNNDDDNVIL